MKNLILSAVALLLISSSAFSQGFGFGLKGGANLTKISGKSFNEEFELGYQLGVFSEIDFSKNFGIQPEVLYSQVNTKRTSGFNAVLGGNRFDGQYARLEAHGFYWTASDNEPSTAPFYNFGQNGQALHRQPEGDKQMAISVRCVRE